MSPAPRDLLPEERSGIFYKFGLYGRLIFRLIRDPRVSPFLKILPLGSLAYVIAPDLFPIVVDDAVVFGLGVFLFIELCPQDVVQEHLDELKRMDAQMNDPEPPDKTIIEADFEEVDES